MAARPGLFHTYSELYLGRMRCTTKPPLSGNRMVGGGGRNPRNTCFPLTESVEWYRRMSIHSSLCPHPHSAMNFWDMTCANVRGLVVGTMFVSARNAFTSAVVIGNGNWLSSRFRAFTKSMLARIPFVYAVSAADGLLARSAASALMNCSSA